MILVVDEDSDLLQCYSEIMTELGLPHVTASSIEKARHELSRIHGLTTVMADFYFGENRNLLELLPGIKAHGPVKFIIVTSEALPPSIPPELSKHIIYKPPDLNRLIGLLGPAKKVTD